MTRTQDLEQAPLEATLDRLIVMVCAIAGAAYVGLSDAAPPAWMHWMPTWTERLTGVIGGGVLTGVIVAQLIQFGNRVRRWVAAGR